MMADRAMEMRSVSSSHRRYSSVSSLDDQPEEYQYSASGSAFLSTGVRSEYAPARHSPPALKQEAQTHVQPIPENNESILRAVVRHWWLESLALLLMVISLAAIIVALKMSQGKPIPQWPLHLSLNTLVSVFGAIFRVPLLFIAAEGLGQLKWHWMSQPRPLHHLTIYDEATRGPWGSLKLLWVTRGRQIAATFSALIAIAAIALDPFSQAVIGLDDCSINDPSSPATIARTNTFGYYKLDHTSKTGAQVALQRAVVSGIMAPGAIKVDFNCVAGNCTFSDPYHAIGYCSECTEITRDLKHHCPDAEQRNCTYALPSGLAVGDYNYYYKNSRENGVYSWDVFFAMSPKSDPANGTDGVFPYKKTGEFPIQAVSARLNEMYQVDSATAFTCRLTPCVKTYTANVIGGNITESLISTTNFNQSYAQFPGMIDDLDDPDLIVQLIRSDCLTDGDKAALKDHGIDAEGSNEDWIPWHKSKLNDTAPITPKCVYQFATIQHEYFQNFLATYFNGSVNNQDETPPPGPLEILYDSNGMTLDSIQATFDSVAEAVTNTIRNPPSNLRYANESEAEDANFQYRDISPAEGTSLKQTSCISVLWPWLALPAVLTIATTVFLVMVIAQTRGDTKFGVWKSSQVALLWHGLDGPVEHEGPALTNVKEMDTRAKNVQVQLSRTDRGWKLAQIHGNGA